LSFLFIPNNLTPKLEVCPCEAVKLEKLEEPQREAERQKNKTANLEATAAEESEDFSPVVLA